MTHIYADYAKRMADQAWLSRMMAHTDAWRAANLTPIGQRRYARLLATFS